MLNQIIKNTIIEALIKVVDDAPTKLENKCNSTYSGYSSDGIVATAYRSEKTQRQSVIYNTDISLADFNVWMDYVYSVLRIAAGQIDPRLSYTVYKKVRSIARQRRMSNKNKTIEISKVLLDYARSILNL